MICIIQARAGSKRLPGKVLKKIGGDSILKRIIKTVKKIDKISQIIIATTNKKEDNQIINICKKNKVKYFRGSNNDVASRFYMILDKIDCDYFMRLNADSPFIDYKLIKKHLKKINYKKFDIVTNVLKRSFPKGQSIEILKKSIFMENYKKIKSKKEREHVTPFFYKNKKKFNIYNYENTTNLSNIKLSVDTNNDLIRMRNIYKKLPKKNFSWRNLVSIYLEYYG